MDDLKDAVEREAYPVEALFERVKALEAEAEDQARDVKTFTHEARLQFKGRAWALRDVIGAIAALRDPILPSPKPTEAEASGAGELLPCPFCGGEAELRTNGMWRVVCPTCKSGVGSHDLPQHAIAAWNRRATPSGGAGELREKVAREVADAINRVLGLIGKAHRIPRSEAKPRDEQKTSSGQLGPGERE